jgi:hypothetical protein
MTAVAGMSRSWRVEQGPAHVFACTRGITP